MGLAGRESGRMWRPDRAESGRWREEVERWVPTAAPVLVFWFWRWWGRQSSVIKWGGGVGGSELR